MRRPAQKSEPRMGALLMVTVGSLLATTSRIRSPQAATLQNSRPRPYFFGSAFSSLALSSPVSQQQAWPSVAQLALPSLSFFLQQAIPWHSFSLAGSFALSSARTTVAARAVTKPRTRRKRRDFMGRKFAGGGN